MSKHEQKALLIRRLGLKRAARCALFREKARYSPGGHPPSVSTRFLHYCVTGDSRFRAEQLADWRVKCETFYGDRTPPTRPKVEPDHKSPLFGEYRPDWGPLTPKF